MTSNPDITNSLAAYIASVRDLPLSDEVVLHAKHHILDTFAAMISGSRLKPGKVIRDYVKNEGGPSQAQVVGSSLLTSATLAALANGTAAHADETDDSHAASGTHPGCAAIPAALALAEKLACNGTGFLKAVVAGYDIGCRVGRALNPAALSTTGRSSRSLGNIFGACAAAASVAQLSEDLIGCALAYAAQQAAGIGSYIRAKEHIEKALVLGGLPARNGVTAVELARGGASGAADPFHGERSFLYAYTPDPQAHELVRDLGKHFEIVQTSIKKYCVGSPIQAPVEALFDMMSEYQLSAGDIARVSVHIPKHRAGTVDNRNMPDVNLQYILALALTRGKLTFAAVHSDDASADPAIQSTKSRIDLVPDPALLESVSPRQVRLEVETRDGKMLTKHLLTYRGTPENPASTSEVEEKARELMLPVIGKARTERLIQSIEHMEQIKDMRELRPDFIATEQDTIPN